MNLFRRSVLAATAILALASYPVYAVINSTVAVCDPANSTTRCLKPDANGALPVTGTFSAVTTADANASAPTYTPGPQPLSQDLSGQLRVTGTFNANTSAQATTAAPTYVNNTANPVSQDLSGNLRTTLTTALPTGANVIGAVTSRLGANLTPADATPNAGSSVALVTSAGTQNFGSMNFPLEFNGTSWDRKRGDVNGSWTQGNVASGTADAGFPVKIGGVNAAGNRINAFMTTNGGTFATGGTSLLATSAMLYADVAGNAARVAATDNRTDGLSAAYGVGQANVTSVAYPVYFNGTSWDRTRGDVNGAWAQGNVASGATDAGNPVKIGGVASISLPAGTTAGNRTNLWTSGSGAVVISGLGASSSDGFANNMALFIPASNGNSSQLSVMNSYFNGTTWDRSRGTVNGANIIPATNSETLPFSAILAASTNSTNVKASPGIITEISVYNTSATVAWLKLYNSATAPTCGTGTPIGRYLIPASANGAGSNVSIGLGKTFSTGISYCVTGLVADADTTATAANTMTVNFTYK